MPYSFTCPNCTAPINISAQPPSEVTCPTCGVKVQVPPGAGPGITRRWLISSVVFMAVAITGLVVFFALAGPPQDSAVRPTLLVIDGFEDVRWVGVDQEGIIYAAEHGSLTIQQFQQMGEPTRQWDLAAERRLDSMQVGADGRVIVVQQGRVDIYRATEYVETIQLDYHFDDARPRPGGGWVGVVDETLLISGANTTITVNDALAGRDEVSPQVALAPNGRIYVLSRGTQTVFAFDASGTLQTFFGDEAITNPPTGITVDGRGRVLVSDAFGVDVFSPEGEHLGQLEVEGLDNRYWGLAADGEGYLYIAAETELVKVALPEW